MEILEPSVCSPNSGSIAPPGITFSPCIVIRSIATEHQGHDEAALSASQAVTQIPRADMAYLPRSKQAPLRRSCRDFVHVHVLLHLLSAPVEK
jgi:hypothetical protein